jgi:hypothetical protein
VERNRAHLEGEADNHHQQAEDDQHHVSVLGLDGLRDTNEIRVTGCAVQKCATEEKNRGCERAEQEILEGAFRRARAGATKRNQRVHAERHGLEPDEDAEKVGRTRKNHRAERGEKNERVELAALDLVLMQIAASKQHGEDRARDDNDIHHQ